MSATRRTLKKAPARPALDRAVSEARASSRLARDAEVTGRAMAQQAARIAELEKANADLARRVEAMTAASADMDALKHENATLRHRNAWTSRLLAQAEARLDSRDRQRRKTILGLAAALAEERTANDDRAVSDDDELAGARHDRLQQRETAPVDNFVKTPVTPATSDPVGFDLSDLD